MFLKEISARESQKTYYNFLDTMQFNDPMRDPSMPTWSGSMLDSQIPHVPQDMMNIIVSIVRGFQGGHPMTIEVKQ